MKSDKADKLKEVKKKLQTLYELRKENAEARKRLLKGLIGDEIEEDSRKAKKIILESETETYNGLSVIKDDYLVTGKKNK